MKKKNIAVLGSTGSIGQRALDIIGCFSDYFNLTLISCNSDYKKIYAQQIKFQPKHVVINNRTGYDNLKKLSAGSSAKIHLGEKALCDLMSLDDIDIVLVAIVGFAALKPTISAIKAKKNIAVAPGERLLPN